MKGLVNKWNILRFKFVFFIITVNIYV